jgi:hypothetical protein
LPALAVPYIDAFSALQDERASLPMKGEIRVRMDKGIYVTACKGIRFQRHGALLILLSPIP